MTTLTRLASEIWRRYVTDGVPASGRNKPDVDEILVWGTEIEGALGIVAQTIVTAAGAYQIDDNATGIVIHRTVAEAADLFLPAVVDAVGDIVIMDGAGNFDTHAQTLKPKAATTDTIVGLTSVPLSAKYQSIRLRAYIRSGADVWLII